MTRCSSLALAVLLATAGRAAAQPGAAPSTPVDAPTAAFLEKRVPDELAIEGIVLSRQNLSLQIQPAGSQLLVSLVDMATGRVAASTKIDQLPADREAAVAAVTHVAADLMTEIAGRPPAPPPPPAPAPGLIDDRAERAQHDLAELRFRRQAIRFGANYDIVITGNRGFYTASQVRRWVAFQGDLDQELAPEDFYKEIGRADLADDYRHRTHLMIGGYVASGVALVATFYFMSKAVQEVPNNCNALDTSSYFACEDAWQKAQDDRRSTYAAPMLISLGVGTAAALYGLWYTRHRQPISENEAKTLADEYNQGLRRQLGLPVAARAPRFRDVKLLPYVAGSEGGLALGGRF